MQLMQDDTKRIEQERTRITTLDSTLDVKRTPYLKNQLLFAKRTPICQSVKCAQNVREAVGN
jgi:hypothetical protein